MINEEKFPSEEWVEQLTEEINRMVGENLNSLIQGERPEVVYESIEDYTTKTGQRFRMTKEEKAAGLSREEAFEARFNKE